MVRGFHRAGAHTNRYGAYAGGPDPLAPPVELQQALEAIGLDVMSGTSAERAMREYLRRGSRERPGLDDLARRVRERRAELTRRHRLDGTLEEVRKLLDHAVLEERKRLANDVDMDEDARSFAEMRLENLPQSTAAAVNDLADYEWQSPAARSDYERIEELLGREMLDQRFAGMKSALEGATDADRQAIRDMLRDLNDLLEKRRLGQDSAEDFDEFMQKHGDQFPENPKNLDELMDILAARAAAAQRMLDSMTPEQREELMSLAAQAFGSPELMQSLSRLDDNLRSLRAGEDWSGSASFSGEEGVGLGQATGIMQDLADLDSLSDQLGQSYRGPGADPGGPGFTTAQAQAFAAEYKIQDGPNDQGEMFERPGRLADYFPPPFPNDQAARARYNAVPPDLSVIAKARGFERGFPYWVFDLMTQYQEPGPDYITALLQGYEDKPPAGFTLPPGSFYNKYYPGHAIAMPPPLSDQRVDYTDGSPMTVEQYAKDISAFLMWTAEPTLDQRKRVDMQVFIFLVVLAGLLYFTKKKIWRQVELHPEELRARPPAEYPSA